MNQITDKILDQIDQNPALLEQLLNNEDAPMTRGGQRVNPLLRSIGNKLDDTAFASVNEELSKNPIIQLYSAASGSLDAKDLLDYTGGTRGTANRGILTNLALRALFDGKLDIKDIILIIVLLKLFKRKTSNTYNNSAIGLLGSLLGFNQSSSYFNNPFAMLLGGNQNQGLFGNTSSGLFGNSYYTNSNSGLGNFLGLTGNNGISNSGLQNLLNFVNGNYNNNSQYQTLYNILSNAAGSCVSNSGTVSSSGLFGVLNQLLNN